MARIFISYRREDSEGHAGRLFRDLAERFGKEAVFMDVVGILPGRDFRAVIEEQVAACDVLLAVIGPLWLATPDPTGAPRIADPEDFVHVETAAALARGIPVIPLLVHGTRMPRADELPEDLRELCYRHAIELTHARWDADVHVLVTALLPYVRRRFATPHWPRVAVLLAAASLIAGAGYVGSLVLPHLRELGWADRAAAEHVAPAMSIAVLPFVSESGSAADQQLADALTQRVTSSIERTARYANVTSYEVMSRYRRTASPARELGRELQVRYIATGTLRRSGNLLAMTAQLLETDRGRQLWSDTVEAPSEQIASADGVAVARVIAGLRAAMAKSEIERASGALAKGASALEITLHGSALQLRDPDGLHGALEARKLYDEALRLDPGLGLAMERKSATIMRELEWNPRSDRDRLLRELDELSNRQLAVDSNDPRAWLNRASVLARQQRWDASLEALSNASRLDPARPEPLALQAHIMLARGRPEQSLALLDAPGIPEAHDAAWSAYMSFLRCQAYMALGRYEDASSACQRSMAAGDWWLARCYLVAAYAQQQQLSRAASELEKLEEYVPHFSIADVKRSRPSDDPGYVRQMDAHLFAGLRKAGVPEQ